MAKQKIMLMPETKQVLADLGKNIRLWRLRRNIPVNLVAKRAMVSRSTVWRIEEGSPSVAMGAYVAVMHALDGMDALLAAVGKDDSADHLLQEKCL